MRTDNEILERARAEKDTDLFGFGLGDLVYRLPFDIAKEFLKDDARQEDWEASDRNPDAVRAELVDYMEFAWDKANNRRGLSAWRSLCHMKAWLWLMGEDAFLESLNIDGYSHYGKPQLAAICDHLNIDWRQWDDDRWTNEEMNDGVPADQIYTPNRGES